MAEEAIFKNNKKMKISQIPQKVIVFLKEVRTEMKKVNWPTRKETTRYTLIIIGLCVGTAVFLGGLDFIYNYLIRKFLLK